jgi:hypothetical protein
MQICVLVAAYQRVVALSPTWARTPRTQRPRLFSFFSALVVLILALPFAANGAYEKDDGASLVKNLE